MVELNYVDFADYLTRPAQAFQRYDHLAHVSQAVIRDVKVNIKISSVFGKIGIKQSRKKAYDKVQELSMSYSEQLWPFKDQNGRFCFATSHYVNMGDQSVVLLKWLAKEADPTKFTLEHYTTPWDMQQNTLMWPRMNGGNVHRDHVYIVRSI